MDGVHGRVARAEKRDFSRIERNDAGLAHTLANLSQVVNGYLELASACTDDEQMLRYLANARLAAQQINELARELQDAED